MARRSMSDLGARPDREDVFGRPLPGSAAHAGETPGAVRVDHVVHYRKAPGSDALKVFTMATVTLGPGESRE